MTTSDTHCANCGHSLADIDLTVEPRIPCPQCGSAKRIYTETIVEKIAIYDSMLGRLKRPSLPSDKKLRWESFTGYGYCHDCEKMVRKVRMFDKDSDEYVERVIDIQTGELIHECIEPFSKHTGHGSAKKMKK